MREQIHHETVTPAEWLFCSDGLLPCFRDNETGIRNGPAFFQQARRAPLHGSPLQPACQTAGSPTGQPPRHPQQRSPTSRPRGGQRRSPTSQQPPTIGGAAPVRPDKRRTARQRDANPLHSNPRRPVTKWRANRHGSHPPEPPSPAPSCIIPRNRRPSAPSRITPRNRRAPPSSRITPRNRRAPPSPRITRRATSARRCACPTATSVPWRGHPARAALSPPGKANHAPGARRCACPTATSVLWRVHPARAASPREEGVRGAENILFLIPEYPLTTA